MSADRINQEGPEPLAWHVEFPIGDGKTAVYVKANERDALELKHRYFNAVVTPLYSLATQPAQPAPSQPVGAPQPAAQPQAVEDADKVDAERCCGWPGDGCPCQVAHESRVATCTVSRASLQMVLQFVDRSQLGIDEDIAECERAIDAARTATAGGKEAENG